MKQSHTITASSDTSEQKHHLRRPFYLNLRLSPVPRNHGNNAVLGVDFDIELGNTADEAKDDPGERQTLDRRLTETIGSTPQMMTNEPHLLRATIKPCSGCFRGQDALVRPDVF